MFTTTTPNVEGWRISRYLGIVCGESVHLFRAGTGFSLMGKAFSGGRSPEFEQGVRDAKNGAVASMCAEAQQLGANGVVGVDLDYQSMGEGVGLLLVSASGTAVVLEPVEGQGP